MGKSKQAYAIICSQFMKNLFSYPVTYSKDGSPRRFEDKVKPFIDSS